MIGRVRQTRAFRAARRRVLKVSSRNYLLVTGCQRSGTTLMLLILDAHPRINGLDESEVGWDNHPGVRPFLRDSMQRTLTCRKLPQSSGDLETLKKHYPHVTVVWMMRNPLAVVSSMRKLQLADWEDNWLTLYAENELEQLARLFPRAKEGFDTLRDIELGARIWTLNCKALSKFESAGINTKIVRYEDLLREPEKTTRSLLSDLGLQWKPSVLAFSEKEGNQNRELAGGTKGHTEIDKSRSKPKLVLTKEECEKVLDLCGRQVHKYGYTGQEFQYLHQENSN